MPTYTLEAGRPDDGVHEVGDGPFPDLPAGIYRGNFYGNDPRLGRIQAGDQRYSVLSNQEGDVASSGNTFQVGTGPQPGLPSGVFRPDDIQAFLRDQARLARAEAAAAQPQPPQINFAAPTAAPVQTTLPSPVAPVAVPSFVPGGGAPSTVFSGGTPNIGVDNLLALGAAGAPGATGVAGAIGAPGIPGFVSPFQSLLPSPSTVPATGTNALAAPNISSGIPASVFSPLFPSVPDISQTTPATAAHGGPILASDSLPRYQVGGDVDPSGPDVPNEFSAFRQFQGANMGTDPYYADQMLLDGFLNDGFTLEEIFGPGWTDRHNRYTGRPLPNMAHGGPILASDFLPGYQGGTEVDAELEARRPEILTQLMEILVNKGSMAPETFNAETRDIPTDALLAALKTHLLDSGSSPVAPFELGKDFYPPWEGENLEGGPTELGKDFYPPWEGENPIWEEGSPDNGSPILASEYLNAGGPVRYFENGGGTGSHEEDEAAVAPGTVNPNPDSNSNSNSNSGSGFNLDILDTIKGYVTPGNVANTAISLAASALNPVVGLGYTTGQAFSGLASFNRGEEPQGFVDGLVHGGLNALGVQPGDITPDEDQSVGVGVDPTTGGSFSPEDTGTPTGMPATQGDIDAALPGMNVVPHYGLMSGHDPTSEL